MLRYVRWALLILMVPVCLASAQEPDAKKAAAPTKDADKPRDVTALFHDGTKVRMLFQQETIEVATKYGKLTVPTADVRRIDFGFRIAEETQQKLDQAMKDLSSDNFQKRESAGKDLLALGRLGYPALVKASKGSDLDTTRRIEEILKAIRTKTPADQLRSRTEDLVHTVNFTIAGKIEVPTLKARTEHFGEVQLKLAELRTLSATGMVGEMKVSVDAGAFGGNNVQWMDSGFIVQPDVALVIQASGEVDLYGNQGGGAFTGPEGNRNYGRGGMHLPGQLIARIGEDGGEVVVVGRRLERSFKAEGKLYLRIVPIPGSAGASGSYQVQIGPGEN